jgi:hypothetical protein
MDSDPTIASQTLQTDLLAIQDWFKKWRMKANESKSIHVTFTTRRETSISRTKKSSLRRVGIPAALQQNTFRIGMCRVTATVALPVDEAEVT